MTRGRPSKKLEIAACAKSLFQKQGYQGTSIDQVVVLSGVSKPTVYSNFSSKQVLWVEVMKQVIASAAIDMQSLESTDDDFLSQWIATWEKWQASSERLSLYRIILGESVKMEEEALVLFSNFETVLNSRLNIIREKSGLLLEDSVYFALYSTSYYLFISKNLYKRQSITECKNRDLLEVILPKSDKNGK
ncbi:TetR/AcrR family transcriptional regulator [Marinomonas sp. 2405UD68-3]|uniref:TetR/AcrR family transcriptional regulator n=1 Tax=Marinomonas sp. 2405UD68-3 TaxID=3391835 RepID=UPI0039C93C78